MTKTLSDIILAHWSKTGKIKHTSSGWMAGNSPCCVHRGESADTRQRGGLMVAADGSVTFNCFNCKYKVSWQPGRMISEKMKTFLQWLGVPAEEIRQITFWSWLERDQVLSGNTETAAWWPHFATNELPKGAKSFEWWAQNEPTNPGFNEVLAYLANRDPNLIHKYDYFYDDDKDSKAARSVIVPFYFQSQIVGWSARKIDKTKYRYMSDTPTNYLFNADVLERKNRKFVLLVEGVFDAINLNCVGVLGSTLSKEQINWLNSVDLPKIVVPDRNKAGKSLVDVAIKEKWGVSLPANSGPNKVWEEGITDVSDAVAKYGFLYVMDTILDATVTDTVEIELKKYYMNGK